MNTYQVSEPFASQDDEQRSISGMYDAVINTLHWAKRLVLWLLTVVAVVARVVAALPWVVWRRVRVLYLGAKFPGPFAYPIVGNLFDALSFDTSVTYRKFMQHLKKCGPVGRVYIGPFLIVYSMHAKDNEVILSGHKHLSKSYFYDSIMKPWLGEGLLISSGAKWRSRRKILTPAFHFRVLEQFAPVFLSCGDAFVSQLRARVGPGSFDVWPLVQLLTLDIICETAMGVKMNAQVNCTSSYVKAVDEITRISARRLYEPWLYIDWIFRLSSLGKKYNKCLEILHGTTYRIIKERREEIEKLEKNTINSPVTINEIERRRRVAFLDLLLLTARDGSLTDEDIREEVDTFMFEGHDTITSSLSFAIYLLSRHQDVQDKVLEELKSVFDWSQTLVPSIQELNELKYLEMVIKESLRLYPPATVMLRDIEEDQELPTTGHVIPAGAVYVSSPHGVHRNEELFPNPETFDPERFSPGACSARHPFAYIPFSAGSRNCIGQRFAMLEMKSVLAKIVWNFRILAEPGFEAILDWEIIMKSKNGIRILLEERREGH